MDFKSISIDQSKISADGDAYFALFDKHIPRNLGNGSTVLLYELANMTCIMKIIALNPDAKYIVIGNEFVNDALKLMVDKHIDVEYKDKIDLKECDMKFDCIVMNPPYQRNLHLKILAEAIKHLKDDKSVCVNLSPVRWLQDPLAKYKKTSDLKRFEESIAKHIENIDICNSAELTECFSACMTFGMGIYACVKNNGKYNYWQYKNQILDKVIPNINGLPISYYKDHKNSTFVPIVLIDGGHKERNNAFVSTMSICRNPIHYGDYFINGVSTNGKTLEQCKADNKKCTNGNIDTWPIIVFDTEKEVKNFVNETKLLFFKYIYKESMVDVHVHPEFLPWLGDAVNPRTGLKGYQSEWTDDDLYKFFNITPEEQKVIKETMEKYK